MIETLAVRITEKTHSLAVACVPEIALIPTHIIENQALILNAPDVRHTESGAPYLSLRNFWMPWSIFVEEYTTFDENDDAEFVFPTSVARIRNAEVKDEPEERDPVLEEYYGRSYRRGLTYGARYNRLRDN